MTCVNGQIAIVETVGYGLRGDAPLGNYVPETSLTTLTFDGANGDAPDAPLVQLTGAWEIQNNKVVVTGPTPPGTIGYKIGADVGTNVGVMRMTYNAEGGAGDEAGPIARYIDADNFFDIVNLGGRFVLVEIANNSIVTSHAEYIIPNYDNTADYQLDVVRYGETIEFYLDGVLGFTYTGPNQASATIWGYKSDGGLASFDNLVLPGASAPEIDLGNYFVWGHSLFTYDGGDDAPANNNTRAGTWLGRFAAHESVIATGGGVFAQIANFNANITNGAYNGVDGLPGSDDLNYRYTSNTQPFYPTGQTFTEQDFSHAIFMASNFDQYAPVGSNTQEALDLIASTQAHAPNAELLMYIHWHEPNLSGSYGAADNLTRTEWTDYNNYLRDVDDGNGGVTRGEYITWHTTWYDEIMVQRRNLRMRCIPVGPLVADLCEEVAFFSTVVYTDLNGDTSPHGTESMYFLAGLITYMVMYQRNPDLSGFTVTAGQNIIPEIANNLNAIVSYFRARLDYYNSNGIKVY